MLATTMSRHASFLAAAIVVLVPGLASAASGVSSTEPASSRIWGGEAVPACGWPTTVAVNTSLGLCSGTLIHPEVVMFAAHCGEQGNRITFGDTTSGGDTVGVSECQTNPNYGGPQDPDHDWAWCRLNEPVSLPVTPIGMGCELEKYLKNGASVAIAGFGVTDSSGSGRKHWGMSEVVNIPPGSNVFDVGGGGLPVVCSGDSGGSAFLQHEDGSWHIYGIHSVKNSGQCDSALGRCSLAAGAAKWIEESSGIDVTPCHDAGTQEWDPSPDCGAFMAGDGITGNGTWGGGCADTPKSGPSTTCGPAFGGEEESNPPVLEITKPEDYAEIEPDTGVSIEIDASDDSGIVSFVQLEIDGELQDLQDNNAPWGFDNVSFPMGEYELVAVGEDYWGNVGESEPVRIFVGIDAPPPDDTGNGGGNGGTDDGGASEDDGGAGPDGPGNGGDAGWGDGEREGCGCMATRDETRVAWLPLLFVIVAGRRRAGRE